MKRGQPRTLTVAVAALLATGVMLGAAGFWSWWTGESVLPFERAAVFLRAWVAEPAGRFFRGVDGVFEMGRLEAEVEALKTRLAEMERVETENARLREALGFAEEGRGRLVAARVVARGGGSGWWRTVTLDKGSAAGLRVGDGVVTSAGLAGRVKSVTPRSCEVMLLSDPNSRVGCELAGDDPPRRGVLVGGEGRWDGEGMRFVHGPNPMELRYTAGDAEPRPGTRVVTSGLAGGLPRGILAGVVEESRRAPGGVAFEVAVRPVANLRDLDIVFVLAGKQRGD